MADQTELEIQELREEIRRLRQEQNGKPDQNGNGTAANEDQTKPKPAERAGGFVRQHPVGLVAGIIALIVLAAGGYFLLQYFSSYESTDDARIEGHINSITPRVDGTITAVYAVENQRVKKGDLLLELDPSDYRVALDRAEANLRQAQASAQAQQTSVPITSTSTQTSIQTARSGVANAQAALGAAQREHEVQAARLSEAEANNQRAQADLARYRQLVSKDEVSQQEYDRRVAEAASAAAAVRAQQAAVAAAEKAIDQRQAALQQTQAEEQQAVSNAPQQVKAQRASVDVQQAAARSAQAAVEGAKLNLQYTKIYAPVDGIVGRRSAEVGQRVQAGQQLLSIVQVDDLWVTALFKENQLRHMHAGQKATLHVDAFGEDYDGYVESMPAASAQSFSMLPSENASGNYVKVVQRLPVRLRFRPGQDPNNRLRPGMSAVPEVWVN